MIVVVMSSTVNFDKLFDISKNRYSWKDDMIIIAGPTCVGKSNIAIGLAKNINGAIINADSVQVYKDLKVLSARPTIDDMKAISHFLYGYVELNTNFSVSDWLLDIRTTMIEIKKQKKIHPILAQKLLGKSKIYFKKKNKMIK